MACSSSEIFWAVLFQSQLNLPKRKISLLQAIRQGFFPALVAPSKYRVVYKSQQPVKFAGFSARLRRLLSLLHESRYVAELMIIRSHNRLLFTTLWLLKNLKKTLKYTAKHAWKFSITENCTPL